MKGKVMMPSSNNNNNNNNKRSQVPMMGMGMGMNVGLPMSTGVNNGNMNMNVNSVGGVNVSMAGMAGMDSDLSMGAHRTQKQQSKLMISNVHSPDDLVGKVGRKVLLSLSQTLIDFLINAQVTALSKDQNGCRFLQSLLDDDPIFVDVIFCEVFSNASDLMIDPFGNYLCQKLMEKCTPMQRVEFIHEVSAALFDISLNIHGTRAVQKLIDCVDMPHQIEVRTN
jgi:hypothetical protein